MAGLTTAQVAGAELAQATMQRRGQLDYVYFVREILGLDCKYSRDPGTEKVLHEVGVEIQEWLENRHAQEVPRKMLITVPRKTFKTSGISEVVPAYVSTFDPNISCGIMSWSYEKLALPIAEQIRNNFAAQTENNKLAAIYGDFHAQGSKNRWSGSHFNIDQRTIDKRDPTVSVYGVRQGAVGHHFDVFILDDPVSNEAMMNDAEWLSRVWKCWIDLMATLNPNSLVIIVNTRYSDADLSGQVLTKEIEPALKRLLGSLPDDWSLENFESIEKHAPKAGWKVIMREAVTNYGTKDAVYNFPTIWSPARVEDVIKGKVDEFDEDSDEYSELFFQYQLQNKPHMRKDNPIQPFHISMALGEPKKYSRDDAPRIGFMDFYCDLAFKSGENYRLQRGDYTVLHAAVPSDGLVWRVNGYRGKPTMDEFGDELIRMAMWAKNEFNARIRYMTIDQIPGQGDGDLSLEIWVDNLFRRYSKLRAPSVRRIKRGNKRKEDIILSTAWAWQEGWVRLCKEAPGNDQLCYQMQRIGQCKPDDDMDAFAAAFLPQFYKSQERVIDPGVNDFKWTPALIDGPEPDDFDEPWLREGWEAF